MRSCTHISQQMHVTALEHACFAVHCVTPATVLHTRVYDSLTYAATATATANTSTHTHTHKQESQESGGEQFESVTLRTAEALAFKLHEAMAARRSRGPHSDRYIDLLVAGVEASLWLGEQFCSDVKNMFPHISIATVSANKLLGIGAHSNRKVCTARFLTHAYTYLHCCTDNAVIPHIEQATVHCMHVVSQWSATLLLSVCCCQYLMHVHLLAAYCR
jgi:hypothetical protein